MTMTRSRWAIDSTKDINIVTLDTPIKKATRTFAFNKAREHAGIDRSHTFHCLRHAAATHMHERHVSASTVNSRRYSAIANRSVMPAT